MAIPDRSMTVQINIRPSDHTFACEPDETVLQAAMRADLMIPYGCRNGACGTCKGRILEGVVDYGPHQAVDAHRRGQARRSCAVLLRSAEDGSRHRSARSASRRRHPDQAAAEPHRIDRQAGGRRRDRQAQAAGIRAAAIPGRPVHRLPAEGRASAQLFARDAAACRRAARIAHPPHARGLVHRSAVPHATRAARSCASKGRSARSICARTRTSR